MRMVPGLVVQILLETLRNLNLQLVQELLKSLMM